MNTKNTNFACDLTVLSAKERNQFASDTNSFFDSVQETRELEHGFALRFTNAPGQLVQIAKFIERESQCCSFLHFALEVGSDAGPIWLQISGEEGTKQLLQTELDQLKNPKTS